MYAHWVFLQTTYHLLNDAIAAGRLMYLHQIEKTPTNLVRAYLLTRKDYYHDPYCSRIPKRKPSTTVVAGFFCLSVSPKQVWLAAKQKNHPSPDGWFSFLS